MVKASCPTESSALANDAARSAGTAAAVALTRAPIGRPLTILGIEGPGRPELEREGLLPGRVIVVTARTPLGGPVVVELGRARLALSADVARLIATAPQPDDAETR